MNTVKPFSWRLRGSLLTTMRIFALERKKKRMAGKPYGNRHSREVVPWEVEGGKAWQ